MGIIFQHEKTRYVQQAVSIALIFIRGICYKCQIFLWLIAFLHSPLAPFCYPKKSLIYIFFFAQQAKMLLPPPRMKEKKKLFKDFRRFARVPDLQCLSTKKLPFSSSFCFAGNGRVSNSKRKKLKVFLSWLIFFLYYYFSSFARSSGVAVSSNNRNVITI